MAKELPSGATTYMEYDDANRLSGIIHAKSDDSIIASFAYDRDSRGNPISEEDAAGNVRYFGYDELSRLTSETWVVDDEVVAEKVYVYDAASNRVRLEEDGEPIVYYTYDARNAMTRVEPLGGTATDMEYNAITWRGRMEGARAARMGPSGPLRFHLSPWERSPLSTATRRVRDATRRVGWTALTPTLSRREREKHRDAGVSGRPGLAVVQEADSDGDTTAHFTHDQGATIMPGVGTILSVREGDDSRFVHTDVQGTTRKVTSAAEAVIAAYDLDAFGLQRSHTGAYSTPYLFTGKERDSGPSLDYFIARQYKPGLGVFVTKDPVGPSEGWYLYVGARPLEAWDPEGQWGCNHRKCPQTVDPDRDRPHHEYDRREVASIPVNACPIGPGTGKKGTLRVERWWHGKVYFFMGCVPTGSWSGRETCAQTGVNTLEEMTAQRMLSCEPDPCGCLWADSCARDFVLNVRAAWDTCTEEAKAALRETIGEVVRSMVEECGGLAIGAGAEVPCLGRAAVVAPYAIGIAEVLGWGVVVWRAYVAGRECWTALKQAQTTYDKCMAEQGRIASQYSNLPTHYTGHWLLPPPPPPGQNFPECALWPRWQTAAGDGRAR